MISAISTPGGFMISLLLSLRWTSTRSFPFWSFLLRVYPPTILTIESSVSWLILSAWLFQSTTRTVPVSSPSMKEPTLPGPRSVSNVRASKTRTILPSVSTSRIPARILPILSFPEICSISFTPSSLATMWAAPCLLMSPESCFSFTSIFASISSFERPLFCWIFSRILSYGMWIPAMHC